MRKNMARAFAAAILLCGAMGASAFCQVFGLLQEKPIARATPSGSARNIFPITPKFMPVSMPIEMR